jgi:uncharacterized membrane protein (DUF485 family)
MTRVDTKTQTEVPAAGWQIKLGVALFVLSIVLPLLGIPLLAVMGLRAATMATISGAMLAGSEVRGIVAVAVMGKSGFAYLKNRVFGFLNQYGPPDEVSRTRYTIGLVMFIVPIMFGWLAPYIADWLPAYSANEFTYAIVSDFLLLLSLFVLGGDFWDKLRALFIHGAKAIFPKTSD